MTTILICLDPETVSQDQVQQVKSLAPDRKVIVTNDREEMQRHLDEVEIAAASFPHDWVLRAPNLRWYQQWGAGADWLMKNPEAAAADFILTNASGVHSICISEHILSFMLAFARGLPQSFAVKKARDWKTGQATPTFELAGKVMLLIGVGAIGLRTAQIASALGIRVWGVRRNPKNSADCIERMVGPDNFEDLLPEADFVVLTIPETAETHHMINAQVFEKMKPSAYIINIGRGGTIDEAAMIEALRSGKIAGAGLDVFEQEPLPEDSPLWGMDNVIITAHYSGRTPKYNERAMQIFIDNLERYLNQQPLKNVVDKKLGY